MPETDRRSFIRQTGIGLAGAAALTCPTSPAIAGKQRIRVALMGCGGRGPVVAAVFDSRDDAELAYVVDPHKQRLAGAAKQFAGAKATGDIRRVLDDPSLDAVIVATPVHWHAPAVILACEAGKHAYVEKPCSHNVREGRLMVEAARRHRRVVQHGTQVRSTSTIAGGVNLLREGVIGDVVVARAWNIQKRPGTGSGAEAEPPAALDYDMWLGPVAPMPYHRSFFSNWNWLQHFGTGEIGNDGIHDIDYARWGLGTGSHPSYISAAGGRFIFDNGAEFPDTQHVSFEYDAADGRDHKRILIYEERLWSTNYPHNCDSGVEFYGTQGQMFLSRRGKIKVVDAGNNPIPVDVPLEPQNTEKHVADFLDAIRTQRLPNADAETAHLTASLCHLGNISTRLGRSLRFDGEKERFLDDEEADKMLAREYQADHWASPVRA